METVAIIKLATGSEYEITQETYNQVLEAASEDFIQLESGTAFKKSAVMEITGITQNDYHQPYNQLPSSGFIGIISKINHLKDLEAFARGLNKAKEKLQKEGRTIKNIDELLLQARKKYLIVKS